MTDIKLGSYAKHIINGFSGVLTGHARYIAGCDQYLIKPDTLDKDKKPIDGIWVDVELIEVLDKKPIEINSRPTGGPQMDAPDVN